MRDPAFGEKVSEWMWKIEGLFTEAKQDHGLSRARSLNEIAYWLRGANWLLRSRTPSQWCCEESSKSEMTASTVRWRPR
jgi:hypothetical protein